MPGYLKDEREYQKEWVKDNKEWVKDNKEWKKWLNVSHQAKGLNMSVIAVNNF